MDTASRIARSHIVVTLLLGCLGTACGEVAGVRRDAAVVDEDAPVLANCPVGCLPPAPLGWVGPTALYDGAESAKPTECPVPYTQKTAEAHVGMTAADPACACGASVTAGRRCNADVVTYSQNGCAGSALLEGTATSTSCLTTTTGTGATYKVGTPTLVPGTCTFPNASTTIPPVAFEKVEVACGLAQAAACVARTDCVSAPAPAQPFTRMCIHQDGDVACPSADYAQRFVAHKTVSDTRACVACSATPSGGACGTSWGNRGNANQCIALPFPSDKTANTCYPYGGIGTVVDVGAMGPTNATCTPTGGTATGTATSTEPVTFCCAN